jgi:hypothetical protein
MTDTIMRAFFLIQHLCTCRNNRNTQICDFITNYGSVLYMMQGKIPSGI